MAVTSLQSTDAEVNESFVSSPRGGVIVMITYPAYSVSYIHGPDREPSKQPIQHRLL